MAALKGALEHGMYGAPTIGDTLLDEIVPFLGVGM